jgi:hypothetical protein
VSLSTFTPHEAPMLFMAVEQTATPHPAVVAGWQDFFSHEMDRAIGLEQESLAAAAQVQSKIVEMFEHESWLNPVLHNAFALTALAMQCCVEVQRNWLAMLAASATASSGSMMLTEASLHHLQALECAPQAKPAAQHSSEDEYAYSMDVAIGAHIM